MTPTHAMIRCCIGLAFGCLPAEGAQDDGSTPAIWEPSIAPAATHFNDFRDVYVIMTFRNISAEPRELGLPWFSESQFDKRPWDDWVRIWRNGARGPTMSGQGEFRGYETTVVPPGWAVSRLVRLDAFHEEKTNGPAYGLYYLMIPRGLIDSHKSAHAIFEVVPKDVRVAPEILTVGHYLDGKAALPEADVRKLLWKKMLESPSDPKWLALLRNMPKELIDSDALFTLMKSAKNVGIRQEAMLTLSHVGKDAALAQRLHDFQNPDGWTGMTGVVAMDSYRILSGKAGEGKR